MHIHLDPVGGIAGDMFIAAMLDCCPALTKGIESVLVAANLDSRLRIEPKAHSNGILCGTQLEITELEQHEQHAHHHTRFKDIRSMIHASALKAGVKVRAIDIFEHLAEAEAKVHGMPVDEVSFHEVGALDSIADIVLAAHIIESMGQCQWSVGAIPTGSGRVMCQHGILPLPAPATVLLLEGFVLFDDGVSGERVTPTGAAILKHLSPRFEGPTTGMRLSASGSGFGHTELKGLPNILRVMQFEDLNQAVSDQVSVITFEVDDQTPEDLAVGLENLRHTPGVIDVIATTVSAKKGRQSNRVQILGLPSADDAVFDACFAQTTTLGVRFHRVQRRILLREQMQNGDIGVKVVQRPQGRTAKAEMDDIAAQHDTAFARSSAAQVAVSQVLIDNEAGKDV